MSIMVTGGAGFIGANFVMDWCSRFDETVVNVDALTYAGNACSLSLLQHNANHIFIHTNIGDRQQMDTLLRDYRPRAIINFAAESHVDRAINNAAPFIDTNILATFTFLEAIREYWAELPQAERLAFRLVHISTDEVFGSLAANAPAFHEQTAYAPTNPYAASKAASDHLFRAWHHTYGLPTIITHCSNNYGPYQFPEKFIPLTITRLLSGQPIPIYGDGEQIRDWLYVKDHCAAIRCVLKSGIPGDTYAIGGGNEVSNLTLATLLCEMLEAKRPRANGRPYREYIEFIKDRPGHDRRYATNADKIKTELGWQPNKTLRAGLAETIDWYLNNPDWLKQITSGDYQRWANQHYGLAE